MSVATLDLHRPGNWSLDLLKILGLVFRRPLGTTATIAVAAVTLPGLVNALP